MYVGTKKEPIEVNEEIFGVPYKEGLIHQVVTAYMAGSRAGTRAQKTRGEVSGGGIKPWKQKGTGRARAGSIRSPLWRKGGRAFPAQPQDHSQKVNRKMYRGAMRSIVSELAREQRLHIVDAFTLADHKTKTLIARMKDLGLANALIIAVNPTDEVLLASRNMPFIDVIDISMIDPVSLVGFSNIVITQDAVQRLEELLA
ncbi:MAG: 50S ribosomal protein L4 [Gammaproteobacteria bacterium]